MTYTGKNLETIALHAGWRADENTGSVAVPIHQTTSYLFESTDQAANLFALSELGNIYTRIMNPTTAVLEERCAVEHVKTPHGMTGCRNRVREDFMNHQPDALCNCGMSS